jgi:two-component system phosphate regulon response regulator PhoB
MANILLIEDEDDLRELITFNIQNAEHTVVATDNANDALVVLEEFLPDLILLDIMLPGLKGDQFLSLIRAKSEFASIPVIVISAKSSEDDIVRLLEAGADDYLTKPFSIKVLLAKIALLAKRTHIVEQDDYRRYGDIAIDEINYKVFVGAEEVVLTHKEFSLLLLFVQHPQRVFTRNQLLTTIWGYNADVYSRTVDSHISTLRKKLGQSGLVIKSIPKIGYKVE